MNATITDQSARDYERVASAIDYLEANYREQPSLDDIAASVHLSKHHFQRMFKRWAGISPTQFMHYLTVEHAKQQLQGADSLLNTALDVGLSGTGRLHDLFVHFEALTPGEYKRAGADLLVRYGFHLSPFGECLVAITERGVCGLHFVGAEGREAALALLQADWALATCVQDQAATSAIVQQIFGPHMGRTPIQLLVRGTNFQVNVWRALLRIPSGSVVTYQDVATAVGNPKAYRAAASAIARNRVGYLIPCHRVINKVGRVSQYRWGGTRKRAMLGWEASQVAGG